jgi:hypothetical protein
VIAHALAALQPLVEPLCGGLDHRALNEGARGVEPGIEIERSEHRLEAVGK